MPRTDSVTVNGAALRAIRERTGLKVADLVTELGHYGVTVHPAHLRNIENGQRNASPKLIKAIARGLRVPVNALLRDNLPNQDAA